MTHIEKMKKEYQDSRLLHLSLLKEMFEVEFPQQYPAEKVSSLINKSVQANKNTLDINISLSYPSVEDENFLFTKALKSYAFEKRFFLFDKQVKHMDVDIENLIDDLDLHRFPDFESLVKEVTFESKAIKNLSGYLKGIGVTCSLLPHPFEVDSLILKLEWP